MNSADLALVLICVPGTIVLGLILLSAGGNLRCTFTGHDGVKVMQSLKCRRCGEFLG